MSKNNKPTTMITGKCRLSYEHVWEPASIDGNSPEKYSACIVIRGADTETLQKVRRAQEAAVQEGVKSKWRGKKPAKLKLPLRSGDEERPEDDVFKGNYFLNASSKLQPGVVDLARNAILDKAEIYSGCYCRFSLNFYPFSVNGNNGVAVGLNNIQKVADGVRLAGGSRAEDDFDDGYTGDGDLDDIL